MSTAVAHLDTLVGLGREAGALTFLEISLRGIVVFVATLVIVRWRPLGSVSENGIRRRLRIHPCVHARPRRQRHRGILPHARRRLSARRAPPSIGVQVAPLTCIWAPESKAAVTSSCAMVRSTKRPLVAID